MSIAEQIKHMMINEKMTLSELSFRSGIPVDTITNYVRGDMVPGVVTIKKISEAMGYEISFEKKAESVDVSKNASGCYDPVAGRAIMNADIERERFMKLLDTIFTICEYANFHVEGRIKLRDKKTGKVWK